MGIVRATVIVQGPGWRVSTRRGGQGAVRELEMDGGCV